MKNKDIEIGEHYTAKVGGEVRVIKITEAHHVKGWWGLNTKTGRTLRFKSARRLIRQWRVC